jgi:hypothetical protein
MFQLGDYVYLRNCKIYMKLTTQKSVELANAGSSIILVTKEEAEKHGYV